MFTALLVPCQSIKIESVQIDGYRDVQRHVGGPFDIARFEVASHDVSVWVHDEGLLVGMPVNFIATALRDIAYLDAGAPRPDIPLVGDALISGGVDHEGESLSIHDDVAMRVEIIRFELQDALLQRMRMDAARMDR